MALEDDLELLSANSYADREAAASRLAGHELGVDTLIDLARGNYPVTSDHRYIAGLRNETALNALGRAANAFPHRRVEIAGVLETLLRDPDRETAQASAATSLVQVDPERAATVLSELAEASGDEGALGVAAGLQLLITEQPNSWHALRSPLTKLLHSVDPPTRNTAAETLAQLDDESAFQALLDAVEGSRDPDFWILSRLAKSPRANARRNKVNQVLNRIVDSNTPSSADAAALMTESREGRELLRARLEVPGVDRNVVRALASSKDVASVPLLLKKLDTSDVEDRRTLVYALGQLGEPSAVKPLSTLLSESELGRAVAYALGEIGDAAAVGPLSEHLSEPQLADAVAGALRRLGQAGVEVLADRFEDSDRFVRRAVLGALLEDRRLVVRVLTTARSNGTVEQKSRLASVLGFLDVPSARTTLVALLHDEAAEVRLAAVDAFAAMTPAPPRALTELLQDPVPAIRLSAVRAVAVNARTGFRQMVALLSDPEVEVRLAAVQRLAEVSRPSTLPALRTRLTDPDGRVRAAVVRSLAIGPGALPELVPFLDDRDPRIVIAAAQAAALTGTEGAAWLMHFIDDPRMDIRKAIASAMEFIDEEYLGTAIRLLDDPLVSVRGTTAAALARRVSAGSTLRKFLPPVRTHSASALDERRPGQSLPPVWADIASALGKRLQDADYGEAGPIASALAAITDQELGPAVASMLLSGLQADDANIVQQTCSAIQAAIQSIDIAAGPFPGWFFVTTEGYTLTLSPQSREVLGALSSARERGELAARAALSTIASALDGKRRGGFRDEYVSYGLRPSTEEDDALIEGLQAAVDEKAKQPRYLDATFRDENGPLPPHSALREGNGYTLEIAIRGARSGVPVQGEVRSVLPLPHDVDKAEILVVVEPGAGLVVETNIASLTLPDAGDSTRNAIFAVTAANPTIDRHARAELRVRLYYRLCLLESAIIRAEVVSRFRPTVRSQWDIDDPIELEHDRLERGYESLKTEVQRALHVDVTARDFGYSLQFTWTSSSGHTVSMPASLPATLAELNIYLADIRRALLKVTMGSSYATKIEGTDSVFLDSIRTLAKAGRDLHTVLFCGDPDSSLSKVGTALGESPLSSGSIVQVSVAPNASDFVLPWAMIYDADVPDLPYEIPDTSGFWGMRYCIEQRLPTSARLMSQRHGVPTIPARMSYMVWSQFRNAEAHSKMVTSLSERSRGRLDVFGPITAASQAISALKDAPASDLYYFFTHAHAREPVGKDPALEGALEAAGPDAEKLRVIYDRLLGEQGQESWIQLTHGQLRLRNLEREQIRFDNAPLVFVNACESARLTPALNRESFATFFVTRGAAAFLGTECTMTIVFAHAFARSVLQRLVNGASVGTALFAARKEFMRRRNPLGLAYSLYGDAGKTLMSPENKRVNNKTKEISP
ncbi:HEAT repeat domain-containing protein [Arthrobacter oryzae]|uniref:HEAT repeat domain-containing protein n=1 Tax=Arthrobacter oryzae TaxID=409290 RepID=UPI002861769F|nr:HEAT repeat domain-containing protein [Arthrobacter oryzae]MDR6508073.1 HEAT repeat protein [Arthrobacter oryzae]